MKRRAVTLLLSIAILFLSTFAFIPSGSPGVSVSAQITPFSWNTKVPCTPVVVRVTDITANYTGSASFSASRFSPGITPPVSGGDAKRWLTPGPTPTGWVAPGPPCTVTNSQGTTSLFVEIDGVERSGLTNEDWSTLYDPANGGNAHSTLTGDTTFNLFDPAVVPDYSNSCASPADATCYGRIHAEIDHDWKAAGYCGTGTVCDNATLASKTLSDSTTIDVQGFVYWDAGAINANWHQFSGWELHPLTAWKLSGSPPPVPFSVSATPPNPQVGEPVTFNAAPGNGTIASSFRWDFGDGVTASGSSVSHIFLGPQSFTVYVTMIDGLGKASTTFIIVNVGSWNSGISCVPTLTTLEGVLGNVSIQRVPSDPTSLGADYSGGGFKLDGSLPYGSNPTTWPFFKRDIQIPCKVSGTPTFVEFHNVTVVNKSREDCSTTYSTDNGGGPYPNGWQSCDVTFTLATPGWGDDFCPGCYMHRLYAGIDRDWNASGIAPMPAPLEGQRIDVQGFVFWNDANVNASFHSYTGWELHPISAWKVTHTPVVAGVSFSPANPTSTQTVTFNGTGSGGTGPYTFNWDFGDGTIDPGSTVTHTYPPGTYSVHLSVTDSYGAVGTASQNVTVRFPPDFAITVNPNAVTFPAGTSISATVNLTSIHDFNESVSLTFASSPGLAASFNPDSSTLVPSGSAVSTLTFSSFSPGVYSVSVIGTSGLLSHSANITVGVVDVGPTISFSESTNTAFRDQPISMTITASDIDGSVTSILVSWGDGTIDNLPGDAVTDQHTYVTASTFNVTVTATDNAGLSSTAFAINTISDAPPVAGFVQSTTQAPTGTFISFDASTSSDPDGTIVSYTWDYGDGLTGSGVSVSHSYILAGNYTVTLTVTDNAALTATATGTVQILDRPPIVGFNASTTSSPTGTPIVLAINATDPDGSMTSIVVSWGDGTIDTLPGNVTIDGHVYGIAGSYTVYVNATDDAGLTTTSSSAILTITDRPPVVNFTESLTIAPTGTEITMTINATDADGIVTGITVDWGDGTIDTLLGNATFDSHTYSLAGSYTVIVSATDDAGLTGSSQSSNTISDRPPSVNITETATTAPTGTPITLTISASDPDGTISQIQVDWGDGTVDYLLSNVTTDNHSYALAGSYTVTVTVTDDAGLTGSSQATNTITDRPPSIAFTGSATTVPSGTPITLTISASDPDGVVTGVTVVWGDGTVDSLAGNATIDTHAYGIAGSYTVYLNATDDAGLTTTSETVTLTISDRPPTVDFTKSASTVPTGTPISLIIDATDPDGVIASLTVFWGDGTLDVLPVNGTSAIHFYALAGPYTITVTVTDDAGLTGSSQATIAITDRPPTLSFTESPTTAPTGTPITLTISASDPDGTVSQILVSWGDGTIDVLPGNATVDIHTYSMAGSYTVTVTATDDATLKSVSQDIVTITDRPPTIAFTTSANTVSTGAVITLAINATDPDGTVSAIIVSWGDGTIDSLQGNVTGDSHSYSTPGDYTVYVNATDDANLTSQSSLVSLTITDRPPLLSLNESASIAFRNETLTMTMSSSDPDGTVTSITVDWGDGTVDILPGDAVADSHAYALAGTFTVNVTATDNGGLTTSATLVNTILDAPPTVSFTATPANSDTGQPITLRISSQDSDGTIIQTVVDWGDGTVNTLVGPVTTATHIYTSTGNAKNETFTISVTVTDDASLTTTGILLVAINDVPPTASFASSATSVLTGESVDFNATASSDPDGGITSFEWVFGDGSTAVGAVVSHSYADTGNSTSKAFTVTLTVTDNSGNAATTQFVLTVWDRSPTASFTQSTTSALTGTSIVFNATGSFDPDGSVLTYSWTFGDGSSATGVIVSHAYSSTGNSITMNYTVTLTIADNSSNTVSAQLTQTVLDRAPIPSFTVSSSSTYTGATISFNAAGSNDPDGTIVEYNWNFGDGSTGTGEIILHSYAVAESYTVTLTLVDNSGGLESVSFTETILDRPPVAVLSSSSNTSLTLTSIGFNATGSFDPDGTIVGYAWDFGDGSTASGDIVSHSYAKAGNYTVVLAVTDNSGSVGVENMVENVLDRAPTAAFTFSPTNPLTGQLVSFDASSSSDPDGRVVNFMWSFGDGSTGTGLAATHVYAANGTYTLLLTVNDDDGSSGTSGVIVTVGEDPAPTWAAGSSLMAIRIDAHKVTLAWTGATDLVQVSSYDIYINGTLVTSLPGSVSSYTVTGLDPLTHYEFRIEAGNPSGHHSVDGPSTVVFTRLAGDVNLDCQVDIVDLAMVGSTFGSKLGQPKYNSEADLNSDGTIDIVDLAIVGTNFGRTC